MINKTKLTTDDKIAGYFYAQDRCSPQSQMTNVSLPGLLFLEI